MNVLEQISRWVEAHREEMTADIARLIAIPSKKGPAEPNHPFGPQPARALDEALALCEKYGFAIRNYDYYVGTADLGEAPARLDILAHLDVVDEGAGWHTDPFTMAEKDSILYGRGVSDDKGPAVAALYAMRAVKELGLPLSGGVRLILGTDEESGSHDLPYYFQREKSAPHSFSPDTSFPVYNTEKGRCRPHFSMTLAAEEALPRVVSLRGGSRVNIVADEARALVLGLDPDRAAALAASAVQRCGVRLAAESAEGGALLKVSGTSAHGAHPQDGNNAITALLAILRDLPLADLPSTRALTFLHETLPHGVTSGKALGVFVEDELSGPLTLAFNLLTLENGVLQGVWDGRTPVAARREDCHDVIRRRMEEAGFRVEIDDIPPHHVPEDSPFIQTLLRSYEAVTGQKGGCTATGGGTYVHNIEGGVAFGPMMPGTETHLHAADERIPLSELLDACKIFALAIAEICR